MAVPEQAEVVGWQVALPADDAPLAVIIEDHVRNRLPQRRRNIWAVIGPQDEDQLIRWTLQMQILISETAGIMRHQPFTYRGQAVSTS